jgi:hypothetical protein
LFFPSVTIPGVRGLAGWNAKQRDTAGAWTSLVDAGNPATPPSVPLDMPFNVNYTLNLSVGDAALNSLKIYPNPTSDNLYITGNNLDIQNVFVSDLNGDGVNINDLIFIPNKGTDIVFSNITIFGYIFFTL